MDSNEVLKHQGWIVKLASKFAWGNVEFLDLVQAGNEGLLIALEKFDPTRGVKFLTYATPWVKKYIREAACQMPSMDEVGEIPIFDEYDDKFECVMDALECLTEREQRVIRGRLDGKTLKETLPELSRERVRQIEKGAHNKLRKFLKVEYAEKA